MADFGNEPFVGDINDERQEPQSRHSRSVLVKQFGLGGISFPRVHRGVIFDHARRLHVSDTSSAPGIGTHQPSWRKAHGRSLAGVRVPKGTRQVIHSLRMRKSGRFSWIGSLWTTTVSTTAPYH
jgi:hypothetical protein